MNFRPILALGTDFFELTHVIVILFFFFARRCREVQTLLFCSDDSFIYLLFFTYCYWFIVLPTFSAIACNVWKWALDIPGCSVAFRSYKRIAGKRLKWRRVVICMMDNIDWSGCKTEWCYLPDHRICIVRSRFAIWGTLFFYLAQIGRRKQITGACVGINKTRKPNSAMSLAGISKYTIKRAEMQCTWEA